MECLKSVITCMEGDDPEQEGIWVEATLQLSLLYTGQGDEKPIKERQWESSNLENHSGQIFSIPPEFPDNHFISHFVVYVHAVFPSLCLSQLKDNNFSGWMLLST